MDGSNDKAKAPLSFIRAGSESLKQHRDASVTVDGGPTSDVVIVNSTQQDEDLVTIIKTEPKDSHFDLQEHR